MTALFTQILTMSMMGALVILIVLASRLLLQRGPKVFCFLLWVVVFLRLLFPLSLKVTVPVTPEFDTSALVEQWAQEMDAAPTAPQEQPGPAEVSPGPDVLTVISWVWAVGSAGVALAGLVSFLRLKRSLRAAVPLTDNVWLADHIGAPFVIGLFRPKIFLPSELEDGERAYILAHERHHIRRLDHITKLLAFAALVFHWFNPLVWIAFHLFTKDMEMSCDEAVLKQLGGEIRSDYSQSLLNLTAGRRGPVWTPLAFGEGDPARRIRNILKWKRPSAGMLVLTAVVTVAVALSAITEARGTSVLPEEPAAPVTEVTEWLASLPEDGLSGTISRSYLPGSAEPLTDGQQAALTARLRILNPGQFAESTEHIVLYTVRLADDHTLCFGYDGGDAVVTVDGWAAEDTSLAALLYHVGVSNGVISYSGLPVPEGAELLSVSHSVRVYSYYCQVCGQQEQCSKSESCGCCKPNEIHHFHLTRDIQ